MSTPLKTVKAGIDKAKSLQADAVLREIHICGGIYDVSGTSLDFPVSMLGGWDCVAWKRATGYGYPVFKQDNVTRFVALTGAVTDTFTITHGASFPPITTSVLVDGINFEGAVSGSVSSPSSTTALTITGAASPTVQNCQMIGGGIVNSSGPGTTGLAVAGAASSPIVTLNKIRGGSGSSTSGAIGSIGLQVRVSAAPKILSNTILGGAGKTTTTSGSVGLELFQSGDLTGKSSVEGNVIDGGQGTSGAGNTGVLLSGVTGADLVGNSINGGSQPATSDATGIITGVISANSQNVLIARNRIYGGDSASPRSHRGVFVNGGSGVIVVNNEIHSGGVDGSSSIDTSSAAVMLASGVSGTKLVHNTLIVPHSDVNWPLVEAINGNPGTAIQNNLFLGTSHGALGLLVTGAPACNSNGTVTSFSANAFVDVDVGLVNDGCGKVYSTIDDLTAGMKMHLPTIDVTGNYQIVGVASADSGAIFVSACAKGGPACAASVVDNWTQTDFGLTGMFKTGGGLSLAATAPCPLAQSSLSDIAFAPLDLLGAMRTAPPSMGAFEDDGTACCKVVGTACAAAAECCSGLCAMTCQPP